MRFEHEGLLVDDYSLSLNRHCKDCGKAYTIGDYMGGFSEHHFYRPVDYKSGCERSCLECWLGVSEFVKPRPQNLQPVFHNLNLTFPLEHGHWYDDSHYEQIIAGQWAVTYKKYLKDGCHLVVLPLARLQTDRVVLIPNGVAIYPVGRFGFSTIAGDQSALMAAALQSAASGVSIADLKSHPVMVFPVRFSWEALIHANHKDHMIMIDALSGLTEPLCFDLFRYWHCRLGQTPDEGLPALPGQLQSNLMMAGALLINGLTHQSVVLGGAAFSHKITRGLGLVLRQPEWEQMPYGGEVGGIVIHALSLYSQMIQTQSSTAKFIQALSLLEFLAFPKAYQKFTKVKTVISRYITTCPTERKKILDRFEELTGKKDPVTGDEMGLRTRIVHIGGRLEFLVPSGRDREALFLELDGYVRCVIDHMIDHSSLSWHSYEEVKAQM